MNRIHLICNVSHCRKILTEQAYITSCSHIFCTNHGHDLARKDASAKCLACDSKLNSKYDFVLMELNPSDKYKTMVMAGLNPDQILEIVNRGLSFFMYQLQYQIRHKENVMNKITTENDLMKDYSISMTESYKEDLLHMKKTINSLKRNLEEKEHEIEAYKEQVAQLNRTQKKLQEKLELCEQELTAIKNTQKETGMEDNELSYSPWKPSQEAFRFGHCDNEFFSREGNEQQSPSNHFGRYPRKLFEL